MLRASDHIIENSDQPISQQGSAGGEIIIEDDVWLASNVVVVSGVRVGKGSVAAAGAGLTRDVQPYTVVGGVPAKFLKNRGDREFSSYLSTWPILAIISKVRLADKYSGDPSVVSLKSVYTMDLPASRYVPDSGRGFVEHRTAQMRLFGMSSV